MKKAFTLIELMIVVVIISILAAIAIPKFENIRDEANTSSCRCNMRVLASAEAVYFGQNNTYTGVIANLSIFVGNAASLVCPINGAVYAVVIIGDSYTIPCPNLPGVGPDDHGSITDGIASWQ